VNAQNQFGGNVAAPSSDAASSAAPGAVVHAYYRALNDKNVSLAIPLLSDTVVLEFSQPYGDGTLEYKGVQAVERFLEGNMQRSFSLNIQEMTVNGDRVEYTIAEWLNPRIVGPTGPFPSISRYIATVRDGKIQFIIQYPVD